MILPSDHSPAQEAFKIQTERVGDTVVIAVHGELDVSNAANLQRALSQAMESAPSRVAVDLSGVSFMDSTGLRTLISASTSADESGYSFALVEGSPQVKRLMELTQIAERIQIASSLSELLDASAS